MKKDKLYTNIPSSEITPKQTYLSRRDFIRSSGLLAGSLVLAACGVPTENLPQSTIPTSDPLIKARVDELGDAVNDLADITGYNNYY